MSSEKLIEQKLRLSEEERAAVNHLKGDRGLNVCFRRAIQQWIARETMLQEAIRLGHALPALYPDAPIPVQPSAGPTTSNDRSVTQISRSKSADSKSPTQPALDETPSEDIEPEEGPAKRRPPSAAETWGSGDPDRAS